MTDKRCNHCGQDMLPDSSGAWFCGCGAVLTKGGRFLPPESWIGGGFVKFLVELRKEGKVTDENER